MKIETLYDIIIKKLLPSYYEKKSIEKLYNTIFKALIYRNFEESYKNVYKLYNISNAKTRAVTIIVLLDYLKKANDSGNSIIKDNENQYKNCNAGGLTIDKQISYYSSFEDFTTLKSIIVSQNNLLEKDKYYDILGILLEQIERKIETIEDKIDILLNGDDFMGIEQFLKQEKSEHNIIERHEIILLLIKQYKEIKETQKLPTPIQKKSKNYSPYELIKAGKYQNAKRYYEENGYNNENKIIYLLLLNIVDITENIIQKEHKKIKDSLQKKINSSSLEETSPERITNDSEYSPEEIIINYLRLAKKYYKKGQYKESHNMYQNAVAIAREYKKSNQTNGNYLIIRKALADAEPFARMCVVKGKHI